MEPVREEDVLAVLQSRLPMRYERLMKLKDSDSKRYAFYLDRMKEWYEDWRRMPPPIQDADIAGQLLRVKVWQILEKLRQQPPAEDRQKLEKELADAVTQQFDIEGTLLEHRLKVLEEDLDRVRSQLQERVAQRDAMIKGRIDWLLRASTQPARWERRGPPPPPEQPD